MTRIQSSMRKISMRTVAVTTLFSVAWIGLVTAAPTPGHWQGGTPGTNDPYLICMNVSADGKRLTALNTQCRGNQGQNQNSIDVQFQGGQDPTGAKCNEYSYRNLEFGDIEINEDGTFETIFTNYWVDTTITGAFSPTEQKATGTAKSQSRFGPECSVNWEATPVVPTQ